MFGNSTLIAHLSIILFSFLTLLFTYLIGKKLFNRKVGIISSLLLLFTPIFFSYSGLFLLDTPLTALTTITLYFAIKSKPFIYFLFSSLTILTKIPGVIVVFGVTISKLIKEKIINKNVILYILPILTFIFLLISNKLYYDKFLYPIGTSMLNFNIIKNFFNLLIILKSIFFDQYRWILTSIFILSFVDFKIIKMKRKYLFLFYLPLTLLFFLLLYNLNIFTKLLIPYFPNIGYYFNTVKSFSILFSFLFLLFLFSYHNFINYFKEKKYLELTSTFLLIVLFYIFIIPFSPRYALPLYPIMFLFFSHSLLKLFKKYSYIIVIIIVIIFILNFDGSRSTVGFTLETNMEYVDAIKTQIWTVNYIEENFPNATVLTPFPLSFELMYPYAGYVKNPINVITFPHFVGMTGPIKNYTLFLNSKSSQELVIDLNLIDLYLYTPQEFSSVIPDISKKLNMTLIKKFELNNKFVEIYKINKTNNYPNYILDNF